MPVRMRAITAVSILACFLTVLTGCTNYGLDSISIVPATATVNVGGTVQLDVTGKYGPHGGNHSGDVTSTATFASANTAVATVTSSGLVTGIADGTTTITATAGGYGGGITAQATITVTGSPAEPAAKVAITPSTLTVAAPGLTGQFQAMATSTAGAQTDVTQSATWTSSNANVASINASGLATAIAQGTTTITATATNPDGTKASSTATFTVTSSTPEPIIGLQILPGTVTVASPGQSSQLLAMATAGGTGNQFDVTSKVKWTSANTSVATISASGVATATGQGTATITAVATNPDGSVITGSATFTVSSTTNEPVAKIQINPTTVIAAQPGTFAQFQAIGFSSAGVQTDITKAVKWTSALTQVATINANGQAVAVGKGATTIIATATNPDGSVATGMATLTVTDAAPEPVASLAITPSTVTVAVPGQSAQLLAIGTSGTGVQSNVTGSAVWTSSNTNVATVGKSGMVTATGPGTATITAIATNPDGTVAMASATFTVTGTAVVYEPIGKLSINPSAITVAQPGATGQFQALATSTTGVMTDVSGSVKWTSTIASVATIGPTGLATATGVGTTTIVATATNPDGSQAVSTATLTVTGQQSEPVAALTLTPNSVSVASPGATIQLIAIGTSGAGSESNISNSVAWSSSNAVVATVSTTGLVTATGQGTTTVTAIATNPDDTIAMASATFTVTGTAAEPYAKIQINPSTITASQPGVTGQFQAIATSSAGVQTDITDSATWTTSNPSVATISPLGLATAKTQGTTTIVATATNPDGSTAVSTATFTVTGATPEPITSLTISPNAVTLAVPGQTSQLFAIATNGSGNQINASAEVSWTSSNSDVATVSASGLVTSTGQGTTTITALYVNPDSTLSMANATVSVSGVNGEPLLSIALTPPSATVAYPGQAVQFTAIGTYSQSSSTPGTRNLTDTATWISSNPSVAKVSTSGLVTATGVGTCVISALSSNPDNSVVIASATFTVENATGEPITALEIAPASQSVAVGQTAQLLAFGTVNGSTLKEDLTSAPGISWVVSVPSVASVSAKGVVTALAQGPTTVTAKYTNPDGTLVTASATINVTAASSEPVQALSVLPQNSTTQFLNESVQFIATATSSVVPTLQDYTGKVKWISSDTTVATVNQSGLATTLGQGTAAIEAEWTNPDGTVVVGSASLTVNQKGANPPGFSTLSVIGLGSGTGWTITAPSATGVANEINCLPTTGPNSVCVGTFPTGTTVTLSATITGSASFDGWSTNCITVPPVAPAVASCQVTLNGDDVVSGIFY